MTTKQIEEIENEDMKVIEIWKKMGMGAGGFSANQKGKQKNVNPK